MTCLRTEVPRVLSLRVEVPNCPIPTGVVRYRTGIYVDGGAHPGKWWASSQGYGANDACPLAGDPKMGPNPSPGQLATFPYLLARLTCGQVIAQFLASRNADSYFLTALA